MFESGPPAGHILGHTGWVGRYICAKTNVFLLLIVGCLVDGAGFGSCSPSSSRELFCPVHRLAQPNTAAPNTLSWSLNRRESLLLEW